jgi:hypothetical protein
MVFEEEESADMKLLRLQGKWFHAFAKSTAEQMSFFIKHDKKHLIMFIEEFLISCSVDGRKNWCTNIATWLFTYDLENIKFTRLYNNSEWSNMAEMIATEWVTGLERWKVHVGVYIKRKNVESFKLYLLKDFNSDQMVENIMPAMESIVEFAVNKNEHMINQLAAYKELNDKLEAHIEEIKSIIEG